MASALSLRARASIRLLGWRRRWASRFARSAALKMFCVLVTGFAIPYALVCWGIFGLYAPLATLGVVATLWLVYRGPLLGWAAREASTVSSRYVDAYARLDADAIAELRRVSAGLWDPNVYDAFLASTAGDELILRERWSEARDALLEVDRDRLRPVPAAMVLNNLAYATARAGDAAAGVALAEQALAELDVCEAGEEGEGIRDPSRSLCRGTLAIALILLGQHARALPMLLELASEHQHDFVRGERLYWLGVAHRALGHSDLAVEAFSQASSLDSRCASDARAALAERRAPYRG